MIPVRVGLSTSGMVAATAIGSRGRSWNCSDEIIAFGTWLVVDISFDSSAPDCSSMLTETILADF